MSIDWQECDQHARNSPGVINTTPQKLTKINPFYSTITINNEWKDLSEQSHLLLWTLLTNKNAGEYNTRDQTDGGDDTEGND